MPHTHILTPEQETYQETHRCVICHGVPVEMESEMIDEYRQARPEYRQSAAFGVRLDDWQTEHVGGEWRTIVKCENGHEWRCYHVKMREGS